MPCVLLYLSHICCGRISLKDSRIHSFLFPSFLISPHIPSFYEIVQLLNLGQRLNVEPCPLSGSYRRRKYSYPLSTPQHHQRLVTLVLGIFACHAHVCPGGNSSSDWHSLRNIVNIPIDTRSSLHLELFLRTVDRESGRINSGSGRRPRSCLACVQARVTVICQSVVHAWWPPCLQAVLNQRLSFSGPLIYGTAEWMTQRIPEWSRHCLVL